MGSGLLSSRLPAPRCSGQFGEARAAQSCHSSQGSRVRCPEVPGLKHGPVLLADVSGQSQPRQPVEHQDRSRGEPRRGVLALPGQGREGAGSGEAVRALEGLPSQVRGLPCEQRGREGPRPLVPGARVPPTRLFPQPRQSARVSSEQPAPLPGLAPRTSATRSVTSSTRPTSTVWWRSAARSSAPWTGPSSTPSEWGSGGPFKPSPTCPSLARGWVGRGAARGCTGL